MTIARLEVTRREVAEYPLAEMLLWRCSRCPVLIPGAGFAVWLRIRDHEDKHEEES